MQHEGTGTLVKHVRRAGGYAGAGSNLSFSSRRPSGTRVGYLRVRQARQRADAGRVVASVRPSSERWASEVAPIWLRTC